MSPEHRTPAGVPTGGQFAASAKVEAAVTLVAEPHDRHPYADALAILPGTVEIDERHQATYTDSDGYEYRMTVSEKVTSVSSDDTSASSSTFTMAGTGTMTPEKVLAVLSRCQEDATDVRAFNVAAREWLAAAEDERDQVDPEFDEYDGTATFGGVTLNGFTRDHPEIGCPAVRVEITEPGNGAATEFEVLLTRDGQTRYVRNGAFAAPLAHWERSALDSYVAQRLNPTGPAKRLSDLLAASVRHADTRS